MAIVRLNQLVSGMVLHSDVRDRSGRVLLRRGITLNQNTLRILKTWGISEVEVRENKEHTHNTTDKEAAVNDVKVRKQAENKAALLFKHNDLNNMAIKELYNLYIMRLMNEISGSSQ